ncbi:TonB-dependent receptor [Capnocytophaga canis]|uniref:TonB-dependent receptor n=1 Tax=Capnocytophaga canis TaxID=1848903 RepID=A0A0B7IPV3_9FLAO|nr:TonB-dependent receptor [Capnocytophaga canis]CEN53921.1 conserved exported hypothetical protein [Capnocytophaga canis]
MKNWFLNLALILCATMTYAQGIVAGKVIDGEFNAPLLGANVLIQGTTKGVFTDADGKFSLQVDSDSGVLEISYLGFVTRQVPFKLISGKANINVTLQSDAESLGEVVVTGGTIIDVVKDRQTPIAVSTIPAVVIQEKVGNQEFPEIMKHTPSVQVAGQAGGYGDARVNVRGFTQDNTAYLLNGQPINGMEDGKVYWSNWSGLSDIANAVQIQRGLGSSKLAISSVGGTVNIVTKATDKKEGGLIRGTIANGNYVKSTVGYSTGLTEKGFGASILFSHWQGDGYNHGTKGQGQTYFISLGWKINDNHSLNLLATGAPQWHDQNYTKAISSYLKYGLKYNNNWGYRDGQYYSTRRNFYHKPVFNLNWDWNISDRSSLSTVLYASIGRGGGTGPLGSTLTNSDTGLIDFAEIQKRDAGKETATYGNKGLAMRASYNNHFWYGGVANFQHNLSDKFTLNLGTDIRRYEGDHFRAVTDLFGFTNYEDSTRGRFYGKNVVNKAHTTNPWKAMTQKVEESQRIAWDYSETITYGGLFGQAEYKTEHISAYVQGSISRQQHTRTDRYQYASGNQEASKVYNNGFNVKGGVNWKINLQHNVFANVGYYSRQPYHDNVYLNYKNDVNPLAQNEKIFGIEAGYQFNSDIFDANLNLYRTSWKDRVTAKSTTDATTNLTTYTTNSGLGQLHQGVELDFRIKPSQLIQFNGFVSYGNWEYQDNSLTKTYDDDLQLINEKVEDVKGGKVGDSPQFQVGMGFVLNPIDRLKFDVDWKYNDNLYADIVLKDNLKLPSYNLFDAGISYRLPLVKDQSIAFRFNVNNLFDTTYIAEVSSDRGKIYRVDGKTKETYQGLDVRNLVRFGFGRTWNFGITYRF